MFKELNDNLSSIEGEVSKLKTAVAHIEQSKEAAVQAVNIAENTNKAFNEHLQEIMEDVDSILQPHKELIISTGKLIQTIEAINFPKKLKYIMIIAITTGAISLIGNILILVLK